MAASLRAAACSRVIETLEQAFRGSRNCPAVLSLKGAAHHLRFPTFPIPRELSDVDLLVRREDLAPVRQVLRQLGYVEEQWNSELDAELQLTEGPGLRFLKDGSLPVDLQIWLPGIPRSPHVLEEVWAAAQPWGEGEEGTLGGLCLLHPMHEFLVAAAHFAVHRKPPLTLSPKWMMDMLLLVHVNATGEMPRLLPPVQGATFEEKLARVGLTDLVWPFHPAPDGAQREHLWKWNDLWTAADRWGITDQVATACATMNAHWDMSIPGVPEGAEVVPLEQLFEEAAQRPLEEAAAVPEAYVERLRRARYLRTTREKLTYLWHLAFPAPANLRARYNLSDQAFLPWHYACHFGRTTGKLLTGLLAAYRLRRRQR